MLLLAGMYILVHFQEIHLAAQEQYTAVLVQYYKVLQDMLTFLVHLDIGMYLFDVGNGILNVLF